MKEDLHQTRNRTLLTWTALTIEIIATAILYASLNTLGVTSYISVLISSAFAILSVLLGLTFIHKIFPLVVQGRRQPIVVGSSTSNYTSNVVIGSGKMKKLIIIPTYNERENLRPLLKEIFSYAPETDVLIVDDNSPDGTGVLADELHKEYDQLIVLHRPGKLGLSTAYIAGFKYAIEHDYDAAFEMDADFSHDPRYLPDFLTAIQDADLVIGSRYIPGGDTPNWSLLRRFISGGGNIFARFMLGIPVHDCTAGYRCYRREVLENIGLDTIQSQGYAFQIELAYRVMKHGFKIVETPIVFMDRRVGKSKMSREVVIKSFIWILRMRFSKDVRLSTSSASHINESQLNTEIPDRQTESNPIAKK